MRCELCPIQDHCVALKKYKDQSYHEVVRLSFPDGYPLYKLIKVVEMKEARNGRKETQQ